MIETITRGKPLVGIIEITQFYFGPNYTETERRRVNRWPAARANPVDKKCGVYVLWPAAAEAERAAGKAVS